MTDDDVWCKSGRVPIRVGRYDLDGVTIEVKRSRSGRFYAVDATGRYVSGLIYRLRAALEAAA